jgi:hypothetical protein
LSKSPFQDHFAVIDLETLAAGSDAPILSLGLTVGRYDDTDQSFDTLIAGGLYLKFNLKEQLEKGRKPSERVVNWWYQQDATAKKVLGPDPANEVSLYDIKSHLLNFFQSKGLDIKQIDLYDRNCFDISKLQYLVEEELKEDVFWNYHQTFDIPTAFRFLGFDRYGGVRVSDITGAVYHNALHDAAVDQLRIYKCLHSEV